jgi:hypothetical protein
MDTFRFRARLDVSIPSAFSGQRGYYPPAFGYGAPHLSARGTLTLQNNALLSTHFRVADIRELLHSWTPLRVRFRRHLRFSRLQSRHLCLLLRSP